MPRIYKGTTPKIAVMYYPCVIDTALLTNLTIALYTESNTNAIIIPMEEITLKDNIAIFELPKYKLDMLSDGIIKYVSEGAYNGDDFTFDRYSDYTVVTPVDYVPSDIHIQQIKYVTKSEYEQLKNNNQLEDNIYLISDATPQYNLKTINGETIVGEGDIVIESGTDIPYLLIKYEYPDNVIYGDFDGVVDAIVNNKPYLIYTPYFDYANTYIVPTTVTYNKNTNTITANSFIHSEVDRIQKLYYTISSTNVTSGNDILFVQPKLVSGENIKTINGNDILGEGDIIIEGGSNIVEITQSEYDAITPEQDTLYVITDAPEIEIPDVSNFVDKETLTYEIDAINIALNQKQNTLVSGVNIKTINGEDIVGEGNIEISGGGSDVPYVVIEYKNAMTLTIISGDLQATLNAAKNNQPFLAYFYNTYNAYGKPKTLYPFTYVTVEESGFSLQYHTEVGSIHKDVVASGSYDTNTGEYSLSVLGTTTHSYATTTQLNSKQDTLISGTNIKTINGNDILGEGDIKVETSVDLTGYATEQWVEEQLGDINTILENILN